ncbi:hypothetical protein GCM10010252_26420 [Streptomyces aureoverticillatus]|nr:hypothetical protein GCM10010252_26420 [Streptomyces aureoverticillatus]
MATTHENLRGRNAVTTKPKIAIATAVMALTALTLISPAASADGTTSNRADKAFGAQAAAAGLSDADAQSLQARIDARIRETGGTQTAANEIVLPDKSELLLPLPGEKYARDLDAPTQSNRAQAPSSCAFYNFCAYKGTNFTGEVKRQKRCNDPINITWVGYGSWSNNQSDEQRARMYGVDGRLIHTTRPAYSEDRSGDWTRVYKVDAC